MRLNEFCTKAFILSLVLGLFFIIPSYGNSAELKLYAAASLKEVLDEAIKLYGKDRGVEIIPIYAGTPSLAMQIANGAEADIFISADQEWMDYFINEGYARASKVKIFAHNNLVFAGNSENYVHNQPLEQNIFQYFPLQDKQLIAAGFINAVPVGKYGKEALTALNLWEDVQYHLIEFESVSGVVRALSQGEADFGIVYSSSLAGQETLIKLYEFDRKTHSPITYPIALLQSQNNVDALNEEAEKFVDFLTSDAVKNILEKYGFAGLSKN